MREINGELASLSAAFSENTLDEVNASAVVVDSADELAGLSEGEIAAAAEAAKARDLEGKYVIALLNTSGQPALSSLEDRGLRERISKTSLARGSRGGEHDNREAVVQIAALRAERAALLGYPHHAAYVLEEQTAQTIEAVNEPPLRDSPRQRLPTRAAKRTTWRRSPSRKEPKSRSRPGTGRTTPRNCGPRDSRSTRRSSSPTSR